MRIHRKLLVMRLNAFRPFLRNPVPALLFLGLFSACVKSNSNNTNPGAGTIGALIKSATNLTLMDTAASKAGLDTILINDGPFTVFVATDPAWVASGYTATVVYGLSDSILRNLILYSMINGNITTNNLPVGPNTSVPTVSGDSVFVTSNPTGIYVNGILMVTQNVLTSNGVIDAMSQLLKPPAGTLLQIAGADTSFSYFMAAVNRTAAGATNVAIPLSNGSINTLFLPRNDAFQAAGYTTIDSVNNANPDSLARVLTYHIVPKRLFTSDFGGGSQQSTLLAGSSLALSMVGGAAFSVQGTGNSSAVVIEAANVMAHNGVIQIIDQLLHP
jgi:uncharacterized surface protein with fasciclin (FAS1) repeats